MRARLRNVAVLAVVLIGCGYIFETSAQVYRCGKVYQDRPCDGAQSVKPMMGMGSKSKAADSSAAVSSQAAVNPVCAKRGIDSQKIVWSREGGATEERMSSGEKDPARKQLIADVYRVRGTAPQVRARIEAECRAEMAEKAKALALKEALVRAGALPDNAATSTRPSPEEEAAEAKRQAQQAEQRIAAAKKAWCDDLNAQLDSIREKQRAGGSAAYMDSLNRQRYDVDRNIRKTGC